MTVRGGEVLRILVADQHAIVRAGIRVLLMEAGSWQSWELHEAETTEQAIVMALADFYSIVLLDYGLPGKGGVKAVEILKARCF